MATLIDSSLLIDAERGGFDIDRLFADNSDEDFAVSAVTAAELLHGVHRATSAVQRGRRRAFAEGILATLPVVAFDLAAARVHAELWAELLGRGAMIGERDLFIAATALALGFRVATRDLRSFPRIKRLRLLKL
jgi:tRNA(fMet)-specific endonuclease VapC